MICADFLAGANLDNGNTDVLLQSIIRVLLLLREVGCLSTQILLLDLGRIENVNGVQSPVDR
jgi:hypothetical protein